MFTRCKNPQTGMKSKTSLRKHAPRNFTRSYSPNRVASWWMTKLTLRSTSVKFLVKNIPLLSQSSMFRRMFGRRKKFLTWQAIYGCGEISASFITSGTINGAIYTKECLKKRLLPFIRKHKGSTLFWPDLASCHYARDVLEWYRANGVNLVPKDRNPLNSPERKTETETKLRKQPKTIKAELE